MINFADFDITVERISWFSSMYKAKEWKFDTMKHPDVYQPNNYSLRFITEGSQKTYRENQPMYILGKGALILSNSKRVPYKSESNELPFKYFQIYFHTSVPIPEEIFNELDCEIMPRKTERINLLFLKAYEIYLTKGTVWQLELKAILNELLSIFFKNYAYKETTEHIPTLAENTAHIIEKNITDRNLNVSEIAKSLYVSTEHLIRTFRSAYGITPKRYITDLRLTRASELLKTNKSTISEISDAAGFSNIFYFNKIFKQNYGMTPSEYRKTHAEEFI